MKFSATELAFFPDSLLESYRKAGSLPTDIVDISDEQYSEYGLSSAPQGKVLSSDSAGLPVWIDAPAPELEPAATRRARAITAIDGKAGAVRAAYSSDGNLVAAEYEQALASAQAWTAAGRPADAVPDDVQCWADATGNSADWAAQDIIDTAAGWAEALTAIRRARLVGKEVVRAAADDADFNVLAAPYLAQLDEIAALAPPA